MRAPRLPVVVAVLSLAPGARAAAPPLRLDEAVQLALTRNERATIADQQVVVADAAVQKARSGFLPTLVAAGSGQLRPYTTTLPARQGLGTVVLNQPVVNIPAWPLYFQAEHLLGAQQESSKDERRLLTFDAANAFMATLSAEQVLEAAKHRQDDAQSNLSDTQARVQAQLNSSNDVTRAEVNLAASQQEVANDTGTVEKAYLSLALLLNAPQPTSLEPPTATLASAARPVTNVDPLISEAEQARPDLLAAAEAVKAAKDFADEPLLRLFPTLGLTGTFSANSQPFSNGRWNDQTVGALFSWTLYDADVRYADRRSRDAALAIAQLQESELRRSVGNDVKTAVASLSAAQAAFQVAARAVDAARRNVGETATLYRQGLARAIELTDANDSRFEAEVGYVSAQYAMAQAYLALRQAMGLDPLGKDLP